MKTRLTAFCLLCAGVLLLLTNSSFGQLTKVWENHYVSSTDSTLIYLDDGNTNFGTLQFDGAGDCYFLSEALKTVPNSPTRIYHPQMQTIKYNPAGATLWIHKDSSYQAGTCDQCGLSADPYQIAVHTDGTFSSLAYNYDASVGYYRYFLASIKANGITAWDMTALYGQYHANMAEDYKGNLIIVANSSAVWNNIVLSKVSSAGNILWSFSYGTPGGYLQSVYPKVTTDKIGNIYVLHPSFGQFPDTADVWVSKYDTSGSLIWDKLLDSGFDMGGNPPNILYNTTDSCLYAAYGIFYSDTTIPANKLVKLTTTGVIKWNKTENLVTGITKLKQDNQGNIYWWIGDQDYGTLPNPIQSEGQEIYKFNSMGTQIALMRGNSFDVDPLGYTYTNSYFFDPKTYTTYDAIRKYASNGILLYQIPASVVGNDNEYTSEVFANGSTNVYTVKAYHYFDTVSVTKYSATCTAKAAPAKPKSIIGNAAFYCDNSNYSYSCPAVANAIYYNWTMPAGVVIDSGQGTTKIYVHHNTAFKTGQVSVYAANCFGASAAITKAVTDTLKPVTKITGPTSVCKGQKNVMYSIPAVTGANYYHWTIPADAAFSIGYGGSGDEGTSVGIDFGNTGGKVSAYAVNYCDSGIAKSIQVKVTACASGIVAVSEDNKTVVYPNPSSSAFKLKLGNSGKGIGQPASIIVKDVSGKVVEQLQHVTSAFVSFGSRLMPGVYFVEVITGDEKEVLKVVKE